MNPRINIATVCGSVRPGNYTAKALALVVDELGKQPKVKVNPINLDTFDLPFPGKPARDSSPERLRQFMRDATGVVIGALVLPNLVSVPRVKEVFDEQGRCLDGRMEKLIRNLATSLL
ncbi:MAG: NADPH-dependent FMN reductase, partial [bacterium]